MAGSRRIFSLSLNSIQSPGGSFEDSQGFMLCIPVGLPMAKTMMGEVRGENPFLSWKQNPRRGCLLFFPWHHKKVYKYQAEGTSKILSVGAKSSRCVTLSIQRAW